jgi:hypothetical protein
MAMRSRQVVALEFMLKTNCPTKQTFWLFSIYLKGTVGQMFPQ